jgi:hypothetical protein
MPLYEYGCGQGHRVERLTSYALRPTWVVCPTCGEDAGLLVSVTRFGGFVQPKESGLSAAIRRARRAEAQGRG